MDTKNSNLEKAIERAEKGEFKEYWLQLYIKDNYKKLGFDSLEGPFEIGYDFRGVYKGEKAVVEAETQSRNFIYHRHDPNEVNILIVLNNDITDEVLGMKPTEWRKSLPKKIIVVDPEDFIKLTHEMRKKYAVEKKEEYEALPYRTHISGIKDALAGLYKALIEEVPYKGPLQEEAFYEAAKVVTFEYLKFYNINLKEFISKEKEGSVIVTRIEDLARDLFESRRKFSDLKDEEKEFVVSWLEVFCTEYISRL